MAQRVKSLPAMQEIRLDPWVRKIPWRRGWPPSPVFLPRKFHGQRSLGGYSPWGFKESLPGRFHGQRSLGGYRPWGCKELDTTEQLNHHHHHTHFLWCQHKQKSESQDSEGSPGVGSLQNEPAGPAKRPGTSRSGLV